MRRMQPNERYGLTWPGKQAAYDEIDIPTTGALAPEPDGSRPHLFIEGDNLDALKLLTPGSVRVIYIDPPYNTGQTMRYRDRFRHTEGEADSRRHAAWLSMMLPRLALARRLLREDGVLFVSIDDREVHHLRLLLNETFGTDNYVATVTWRKKVVRGRGARHVLPQTEYVLVYARHLPALPPFGEPLTDDMRDEYGHEDDQGRYKLIPLAKSGTSHSARPNLVYPIAAPDGSAIPCPTHQWRWSKETLAARMDEIVFKPNRAGGWRVFTKQYLDLPAGERERTPISYYDRATTTDGTKELKRLFGRVVIDFPKPTRLIKDLITWAIPRDAGGAPVILDFFAGSCPTAQAVLELNAEDGGDRRFICVQAAAPLDDPEFATLAEVGLARIHKVLPDAALVHVCRVAGVQEPSKP
ncbi:MAG: adenine specific methylase Mod [Cyanobacteria bacterium RYN_339]|nr:adenine specific methylase Mod [Cyanobacteria bacterium RYN_339]